MTAAQLEMINGSTNILVFGTGEVMAIYPYDEFEEKRTALFSNVGDIRIATAYPLIWHALHYTTFCTEEQDEAARFMLQLTALIAELTGLADKQDASSWISEIQLQDLITWLSDINDACSYELHVEGVITSALIAKDAPTPEELVEC